MAQYFWKPNPADLGSAPTNFSPLWHGSDVILTVKNDGTEDYLEFDMSAAFAGNKNALLLDSVGGNSLSSELNPEIYLDCVYESDSSASTVGCDVRVVARADVLSSANQPVGYFSGIWPIKSEARIETFDSGVFQTLASGAFDRIAYVNDRIGQRIRHNGSDIKAKWWLKSAGEQAGWVNGTDAGALEITDTTAPAAGALGIISLGKGKFRIYGIGVGTEGDTAPTSEPTPTASLSVTEPSLSPGDPISGTYANYATVPTTLTVSDGTNTITIASPTITDNGDGTGTFSGTMPALPTTGTASLVLFGDVTVELT